MELKFLGRGSAFNPKEGNTSSYFIEDSELFLIDCGESVFERLCENELLNGIDKVNLMITHTHSDHIGSLGSFIMYSYFKLGKPVNIVMKKGAKHVSSIDKILEGFGCTSEMYRYIDEEWYDNKFISFHSIRYKETRHKEGLNCYGLIFKTTNGLVYYSGDTKEIETIKYLIESGENIDKLYIDTTTEDYPDNVHLYIGVLREQIPEELKSKVYCMHFNNDLCIEEAKKYGFNVVEVEHKNAKSKVLINKKVKNDVD